MNEKFKKPQQKTTRAFKDLVTVSAISLVVSVLVFFLGVFRTFQEWVREQPPWSEWYIHDYLFILVILAFALGIFSLRRWIELSREIAERKRVEDALRNEKALLDALMDHIPDSIYFKDRQCRLVRINRKEMRDLNLDDMSQVIGKTDVDLFGEEFGRKTLANDQHLMESGEPVIGLIESRQLEDGQVNWTSTTKVPLRDASGQIVGLVGITREINELMRAQEEREHERNLLRTVIDNLPDGVYVKDTACRKTIANLADLHQMGCTSEAEALGKTDFDFFPPEVAKAFFADDQSVIQTGQPVVNREEYFFDAEGEKRWLLTTKVPLRDQKGQILGLVGIGHDITKRKRAEDALAAERNKLRTLIDNLPDRIYVKDTESCFLINNAAHIRALGAKTQYEVVGKTDFDFRPHEIAAHSYADDQQVMHSGQPLYDREEATLLPTGERGWLLTTKVPLRDQQGEVIGLVGISRDITERKRVEEALRKADEELEQKNRELQKASEFKSEFLANMSHEIRTPMNSILGMAELCLETELNPEQRHYLNAVHSSSQSLLSLLNDVLDISKIEAGKMELNDSEFILRTEVGRALKFFGPRASEKGVELLYYIPPDIPNRLVGDPLRLRQVLVNLVGNAMKFTERGHIVVRANLENETHEKKDGRNGDSDSSRECILHFTVSDTGIGIPHERQPLIFDSFVQGDGSVSRKYGGSGLGLAISSKIIEIMGGKIWVESEVGKGSTFHFTAHFGIAKKSQPVTTTEEDGLTGLRVLIVDDNETTRALFQEMLTAWRMKPKGVGGGEAALVELNHAAASDKPYPLVLLDLQMPGTDGFKVLERIHDDERLRETAIIIVSILQTPKILERLRKLEIDAVFTKPFNSSDLLGTIQNVMMKKGFIVQESQSEDREAGARVERIHRGAPPQGLRILLAEDNPLNQEVAAIRLRKRGHNVVIAKDGREALSAYQSEHFDLILMDVHMPEMDGVEATAKIRKLEEGTGRHIPIIALTASAMKGDREKLQAAGMDEHVAKPIQTQELLDTIERVVRFADEAKTKAAIETHSAAGDPTMEDLLSSVEGDKVLLKQLIATFNVYTPKLLVELREGIDRADFKRIRYAAHTLKGSFGTLGAKRAWGLAQHLEETASAEDLDAVSQLYEHLKDECQELEQGLEKASKELEP